MDGVSVPCDRCGAPVWLSPGEPVIGRISRDTRTGRVTRSTVAHCPACRAAIAVEYEEWVKKRMGGQG